jgi:hypothetical protein
MEKFSRLFSTSTWEKLSNGSDTLSIIRENLSKAYIHPASPKQILDVLDRLPSELTSCIKAVVLRRLPKSDEEKLVEARIRYFCIILNSFPRDLRMVFTLKPVRSVFSHMEPWRTRWEEKD